MTPAQQQSGGVREDYRPLTDREREILEMLLSVDIDLKVDRKRAPRSSVIASVEAITREREDVNGTFDLLLWVDDGWLAGVEIVDYVDRHGEESPDEIPPLDAWNEPQARVRRRSPRLRQ